MSRVNKGKTDLWTTRPDVASMLVDDELGYNVTSGTHKKADFVCPDCGSVIKDKYIRKVCSYGLKCPVCYDGISYPERLLYNIFINIGITPIRDKTLSWSNNKRYDFYIEEYSTICETHGLQHYSDKYAFSRVNHRDEYSNDIYKKNLAIENGIKHYIELDCRKSDFDYIYDSIMNSAMPNIFDLDNVDWDYVKIHSLKSLIIETCELYNKGMHVTSDIAQELGLHDGTVIDYLRKGANAGLCDYTDLRRYKDDGSTWYKKDMICVDTQKIYHGLDEVAADGYNPSQVSALCNHYPHVNTVGGHNWCFLDEYDPDTFVMKPYDERAIPKSVICYETGKIYERLVDVKQDGFSPSGVSNVCNGRRKHHKHKHFGFVDEEDIEQLRLYAL